MRRLLIMLVLFLCNTANALEYPPEFDRWDSPDIVTVYREFKYEPRGLDAVFSNGQVDTIVTYKSNSKPAYALINMPGGDGSMHLSLDADKKIKSFWGWNTYTRMRKLFAQNDFYVVTLDATDNPLRIRSIVQALEKDYPGIKIYIAGISRSTRNTMSLSKDIDGEVAGFIHTSSMGDSVHSFNTERLVSKNVFIHNKDDTCKGTPYSSVQYSAERYNTKLITLDGGNDYELFACGPFTTHGFYRAEIKLFNAIVEWIKQ